MLHSFAKWNKILLILITSPADRNKKHSPVYQETSKFYWLSFSHKYWQIYCSLYEWNIMGSLITHQWLMSSKGRKTCEDSEHNLVLVLSCPSWCMRKLLITDKYVSQENNIFFKIWGNRRGSTEVLCNNAVTAGISNHALLSRHVTFFR